MPTPNLASTSFNLPVVGAAEHRISFPCEAVSESQTKQLSTDMEARYGCNQGQSRAGTSLLQNARRGQRNQAELFLALSSLPNAEAAAGGMVAPLHLATPCGIISAALRVGLQRDG